MQDASYVTIKSYKRPSGVGVSSQFMENEADSEDVFLGSHRRVGGRVRMAMSPGLAGSLSFLLGLLGHN